MKLLLLVLCVLLVHINAYRQPIPASFSSTSSTSNRRSRIVTMMDGIERRDLLFSRSAGLALLGAATMITSPALAETTKTKKVSASKVRETANGVKYVDVAKGDGLSPKSGDFVVINYTGYLPDGTIFDGQHAVGKKPLAFKYGAKQVIPGLEEALESMKPGGERQILVPPQLAFGEKGVCVPDSQECLVPPNSPVKYDVIVKRVAVSPI